VTKQEAVRILIRNAAANCAGVGQGFRTLPNESEMSKVKEAIKMLWKASGYQYELTDTELFNMGFH